MHAYQLRVAATAFGALTLYLRVVGPLSGVQRANAPSVAEALARVLAASSTPLDGDSDAMGTHHRAVVHQAEIVEGHRTRDVPPTSHTSL